MQKTQGRGTRDSVCGREIKTNESLGHPPVNFAPFRLKQINEFYDKRAFKSAWKRFAKESDSILDMLKSPGIKDRLEGKSKDQKTDFARHLWEKLVYESAKDPGKSAVFAHCHRFQAEYKMFLHLTYSTVLFAIISLRHFDARRVAGAIVVAAVFYYCGHRRNVRRWWQVRPTGR